MTLKQGEEINHKFSSLNDSIQKLNFNISKTTSDIKILFSEKEKVNTSLIITSDKLFTSEKEITRLQNELKIQDKEHWKQKNNWARWMFFSFMMTVIIAALK